MIKDIKYWAGLFDADGSFTLGMSKRPDGRYYGQVKAVLYQKDSREFILKEFAEMFDVNVKKSGNVSCVSLDSSKARIFMEQVKNHLIIKKSLVEELLRLDKTFYTKDTKKEINDHIKTFRFTNSTSKQFPSRKWLAGYVDGDGCINSYFNKKTGLVEFSLRLVSHKDQDVGLQLVYKHLGGILYDELNCRRWVMNLSFSTREKLAYFGKHLKIKSKQYDLVYNTICNQSNLKKNGATPESNLALHQKLKSLNSI